MQNWDDQDEDLLKTYQSDITHRLAKHTSNILPKNKYRQYSMERNNSRIIQQHPQRFSVQNLPEKPKNI